MKKLGLSFITQKESINMEEVIIKMIEFILGEKFPGVVNDITVTRDRDMSSFYTDEQKNYVYNIFIDMDEKYGHLKYDIVILVENTLKTMGITNRLAFYWNHHWN